MLNRQSRGHQVDGCSLYLGCVRNESFFARTLDICAGNFYEFLLGGTYPGWCCDVLAFCLPRSVEDPRKNDRWNAQGSDV